MTQERYRAWRFDLPGHEETMPSGGIQIGSRGAPEMVSDDFSIRQALLLLISTARGERVMRPNFGCDLHRLAFAPNDDTTAGLAIHMVRRAITLWEPRVRLLRVDADRSVERPGVLHLLLDYAVLQSGTTERLAFDLDLNEGGT